MLEKGFTLVETLVAIAILSIVLLMIYTTYANSVNTIEYNQELIEVQQKSRLTLDIMSKTIQGAFYDNNYPQVRFVGQDHKIQGSNVDSLNFFSLNHPFQTEDQKFNLIGLGYELTFDIEKNNGRLFVKRNIDIGAGDDDPKEDFWELCDNVEQLNLEYYDGDNNKWLDDWNSEEKEGLPSAVKIEILLRSHERKVDTFSNLVTIPLVSKKQV